MKTDTKPLPKTIIPFIGHFIAPYKGYFILFVLLMVISGLDGVLRSYLIKWVVDTLDKTTAVGIQHMVLPLLLFAALYELHSLTWRGVDLINYKIQPLIKNNIISKTLNYVYQHSHRYFQDHFSGSISNNINVLAENIEMAVHDLSRFLIRGFVVLITALVGMYFVHPVFFWGLFLWTVLFLTISFSFSKKIRNFSNSYAESQSQITGQLVDGITNIQNIRLFSRRTYESIHIQTYLKHMQGKFRDKAWFLIKFYWVQGLTVTLVIGFMAFMLVKLKAQGLVTTGDFVLILGLIVYVGDNLWWVTEQVDRLNDALGRCNQSLTKLFIPLEIRDVPNATPLQVLQGEIVFNKVLFHYKGADPLFQNKSIRIAPGEKVGLVGYSGSGKSTFVHLILRFYDINSGSITIDGQDIRAVTQDSLREAIAFIPQDPSLFHRSLLDNIRYGKLDATDTEVIEAAKQAHAHEFIEKTPEQYQTLVGERGIKLSGGQRQRIAIARAMLKNAPILILDEATSQLDSVTEVDIQDTLWKLMQGKTTLVIAHRLSTLLHMDRILVFDQGKIVESGSHKALLAKKGFYKTLWDAQVGGFLPDTHERGGY